MSRARDMANLGAQAGSGLDASDITTGTLGNTVQDNITRLGTVTTGTLGSATVFPAGHILQVKVFNGKVGSTFSTAEYSAFQNMPNTDWESDIYPNITITGGNKIFVSTQMEVLIYGGGADNQGFFKIYDVTNTTYRGNEGNMYSHNAHENAHNRYECAYVNIHALFTQSSSAKQEFSFSIKAGSGGTVDVWHAHGTMTLMEVKA